MPISHTMHVSFQQATEVLECSYYEGEPVPKSALNLNTIFFFFSFIFISWRLITLQYCGGFCHTVTWISHGFTCVPHPDPPSHLPPHPIPLGLPSAPALSTCLYYLLNTHHNALIPILADLSIDYRKTSRWFMDTLKLDTRCLTSHVTGSLLLTLTKAVCTYILWARK